MKQLNEKAMLVKLTMRKANLTKRDQVAESIIQSQLDDSSLIVNSKLFRDKTNPINKIMSEANEVYTYHKNNTIPYLDKGPRLLPNGIYMEYTQAMRDRINRVDQLLNNYLPNYDTYVQLDIQYRSKNQATARAKAEDYPSADDFRSRMGFELRFMPLPDKKHFLFDLDDTDIQNFEQSVKEAERVARSNTIKLMLEPLTHLVDKLSVPIGQDGHIFRDTALENVIEGLQQARKLNIDEDPEITATIGHLSQAMTLFNDHKDSLRESPVVRSKAHNTLDAIASKMKGLM